MGLKQIQEPAIGTIKQYGTRFQYTPLFDDESHKLVVQIEELEHEGQRTLNGEMVRAIAGHVETKFTALETPIEYQVKRLVDQGFKVWDLHDQAKEIAGESASTDAKDPYYTVTKKTNYTLEEAGPEEGEPGIFVLSNADSGRNTAYLYELEVAQKIADKTGKPLSEITLYVQQANGEYLPRTFKDYSLTQGEEGVEDQKRTPFQQNYQDREDGTLPRDVIDRAIDQSMRRPEQIKPQDVDLSKHTFDR